jgi:electron transfer flavoprotein beta subunit
VKIAVCLKEVVDSKLSLDVGLRNGVVFREGLPLRLNPNDAGALSMALSLRQSDIDPSFEITVISIGPERVEDYLRWGISAGANKAIRIWDEGFTELSAHQKAWLLSRAVSMSGADIVFTGARSLDTGNGQVGHLMAAWLGLPCVGEAVSIESVTRRKTIDLIRDIGVGEREKVECSLPAVITVKGEGKLLYASLDRLMESRLSEIKLLSLADLDLSVAELENDHASVTRLMYPRPRPRKVPTPDMTLPSFYRILKLLEGGISRRQGVMLKGSSAELTEQLFQLLVDEGVIKLAPL